MRKFNQIEIMELLNQIMKVKGKRLLSKVKVVTRKLIMLLQGYKFLASLLKKLYRYNLIVIKLLVRINSSHLLLWHKN